MLLVCGQQPALLQQHPGVDLDPIATQEALHDDIASFLEAVTLCGARLIAAGSPSKGNQKRSVADEAQLMQCAYLQLRT